MDEDLADLVSLQELVSETNPPPDQPIPRSFQVLGLTRQLAKPFESTSWRPTFATPARTGEPGSMILSPPAMLLSSSRL